MPAFAVFVVLTVSGHLWAQAVSVGLRTGILVTPPFSIPSRDRQGAVGRFMLGPCVEMHLWHGVGLGVDLLLRRSAFEIPSAPARVTVWQAQAPATFIYRFRGRGKPFLRTGVAFNRVLSVNGATPCERGPFGEQFYCAEDRSVAELRHRSTQGFVAGGGASWKFGKLRFEPELRLTRWFDRNFGVRGSGVRSNLNEAALLAGVTILMSR